MPNKLPPAKAVRFIQGGYPDSEHDIEKRSTTPRPVRTSTRRLMPVAEKGVLSIIPRHTLTGIA